VFRVESARLLPG